MAKITDTLITEYRLVDRYTPHAKKIADSTRATGASLQSVSGMFSGLGNVVQSVAMKLTGILVVASASVVGFGVASVKSAASLESMKLGLMALLGSASAAEAELKLLREASKLPGLGFREAVTGATNLIAAGMSAENARVTLIALGNALALVGRGKDDLREVVFQLTQMIGSGKLQGDELKIMSERIPLLRRALKEALGTLDTDEINKKFSIEEVVARLTQVLLRMPKAVGGIGNEFSNLADDVDVAMAEAGAAINKALLPVIQKVSSFISYLADSGVIKRATEGLADMFDQSAGSNGLIRALAYIVATVKNLPGLFRAVGDLIGRTFEVVGRAAKMALSVFALIFGVRMARAVLQIAGVMWELYKAVRAIGIATVILAGLRRGIAGLLVIITTTLAAVAAIQIGMDRMLGSAPAQTNVSDSLGNIERDANASIREYESSQNGSFADTFSSMQNIADLAVKQAEKDRTLKEIASNTKQTAQNTLPMVDLTKIALGGGQLGGYGVAATELSQIKRGTGGRGGGDKFDQIARLAREATMEMAYQIVLDQGRGR